MINKVHVRPTVLSAILTAIVLVGCASSGNNAPNASSNANDTSKAEKKISMAIGQEVGRFSIVDQTDIDAPMGLVGTQYSVKTKDGKTFKCDILESSSFGKAMTFGTGTGAAAMCTDFTSGSKDKGKTNAASCNALLKAAGKC